MTSQTGKNGRVWRRTVVSGALAAGLVMGFGSGTANADVLDDIGAKYMQGASGGQVSNFVKEALTLRALGFKPSKGNLEALQAGWDYLPNQTRLVEALQETVSYQRKRQAQMQNANAPQVPGVGTTPLPPGVPADPSNPDNTGIGLIPGGGVTQPIG